MLKNRTITLYLLGEIIAPVYNNCSVTFSNYKFSSEINDLMEFGLGM